ncbi:1-aminocyclopropane-1-carboxylate deaminase/D-cysteine desulfhydrase [Flagellimonas nanhaiensis]|uniref:1-aminocyclopropane-1-carboxylate deaminase/D-cysteine desulfhydrase n=1 Tax=Flagellimonas nanhaiensis TaxID=2292706 RepID=UPI0015F28EED|nr:pyridoxal-phosphate dependent enzyme [Allomuricauda nanhaiensis]
MIQRITDQISVFRDDLYPYLGGGNKARKMMALDEIIKSQGVNAIVTTGGIQSNHCRAVALYSKKNNIKCTLVLHGDQERLFSESGNAKVIKGSGATMIFSNACEIGKNMDVALRTYREQGYNPFYLNGGGHTLEGGYCYTDELEKLVDSGYVPDYIFLASGSGTTQAGLLAGVTRKGLDIKVIGISVGRTTEKAENCIQEFYKELCKTYGIDGKRAKVIVDDSFLCGGYEKYNNQIKQIADDSMANYGFPLDTTYTAKAFYGMQQIIEKRHITGQVLFWYTGGIYNYLAK